MSIPKYPGPRRLLRLPDSPGNGNLQLLLTKFALADESPQFWPIPANTLGSPLQSENAPVFGLAPFSTAFPVNSQFVGKSKPLPTLKGKPLVHLASPDPDQPPRVASNARFQLAPHFLPRPTGNSYTQLVLNWWVVS